MLKGLDLSHHQGIPDFRAIKAAGYSFVILKATEGVGYVDPVFAVNRAAAHAAGLLVGVYHFARAGDPAAEASFFLRVVGALAVGEFVVCDWEVTAPDPVGWCTAWCDTVRATSTVKPLVYLNRAELAGHDWAPLVAHDDGLWLAAYDGTTTPPSGGPWGAPAMKQFTDAGTVAGVAGAVDLSVFYGTADQLARYGLQPTPTPAPGPAPKPVPAPPVLEDDMPMFFTADQRGVALIDGLVFKSLTADQSVAWGQALGRPPVTVTPAVFDLMRGTCTPDASQSAAATKLDALTATVTALQQAVAAAPGMTCQGNPKAVLTALGQAATTAAGA